MAVLKIFDFYKERLSCFETEYNKAHSKSKRYSYLRLFVFLTIILCVFAMIKMHSLLLLIIPVTVLIILFIYMVVKQNNLEKDIDKIKRLIQINKDESLYINHSFEERDTGEFLTRPITSIANDFDLFGKCSLFQYLNRCRTKRGKSLMAEKLTNPDKDTTSIKKNQKSISELTGNLGFTQEFQSIIILLEHDNTETIFERWLEETNGTVIKTHILVYFLLFVNIILLVFYIFDFIPWSYATFFMTVSYLYSINQKVKGKLHKKIEILNHGLKYYIMIFELIEKTSFETPQLRDMKNDLFHDNIGIVKLLRRFKLYFSLAEITENRIISLLFNSTLLLDIQIYSRLFLWKNKYHDLVLKSFEIVHELETLISFSTFSFNNSECVISPTIEDSKFNIKGECIGHPLISYSQRITNSFELVGLPSVLIITGANMAGKSTFLKSVAINLILAMNGAPVIASKFVFTPCDIKSSIKIQDSLSNNESYFYAELLKLKEIVEHSKKHHRTLVILDEILRGTNSKDKQIGSLGVIEKLIKQGVSTIITTHDLSIGKLEYKYPNIVSNNCFEVELINDKLFFDYKLKKGISNKINASYLLKKMEIVDSI